MTYTQLPNDIEWVEKASLPQVTARSTLAGLFIGSIILISNFQFGLQTGWVSMMSLPSALLGFALFKSCQKHLHYEFTDVENVYVQSVSVAVATGPLAYGFVGIIPAIEKLMTNEESGYEEGIDLQPLWKLIYWSAGVAFFGVFFAIPLRRQFVIKEKLPFPSGSATATLISVFHGTSMKLGEEDDRDIEESGSRPGAQDPGPVPVSVASPDDASSVVLPRNADSLDPTPANSGSALSSIAPVPSAGTPLSPESEPMSSSMGSLNTTTQPFTGAGLRGGRTGANADADSSDSDFHGDFGGVRPSRSDMTIIEAEDLCALTQMQEYKSNLRLLAGTSTVAAVYTVFSYFVPEIRAIPVLGNKLSKDYLINFQPSPAYIGQGIIMGFQTTAYMMFGAILGWFILSPLAKWQGWAPGATDDWKTGSEGWIMWISLAIMISDSVVSLLVITSKAAVNYLDDLWNHFRGSPELSDLAVGRVSEPGTSHSSDSEYSDAVPQAPPLNRAGSQKDCTPELDLDGNPEDVGKCHLVPTSVVLLGLLGSALLCLYTSRVVFGVVVPHYAVLSSIVLSLFLSILGVKALGETDLNPVSGIGKISQLICAVMIPRDTKGAILINLISGGISEATTQQAGDLMQDLKTGFLLGASPKAQFVAQIVGSLYSILLSSIMYKVYNSLYEIPGKMFKIPTAVIWIDCARLVNGSGLPPYAFEFSMAFGAIFGLISLAKNSITCPRNKYYKYLRYLPDGVPVGIGIYNVPSFTFARFIGGLVSYYWLKKMGTSSNFHSGKVQMIIFSSGLVLGEGLFSVVNMLLASMGVPHL